MLVDKSVNMLVLSIEMSGIRGNVNLGASEEHFLLKLLLRLLPSSTLSYSATIWVVLVDESVDELIPSIKMMAPSLPPSSPIPTPPFLGFVVDSILLEVFNTKVSTAAFWLNLDEPLVKFGKSKKDLDINATCLDLTYARK